MFLRGLVSTHEFDLKSLFELYKRFELKSKIYVAGIQVKDTSYGEGLSPELKARLDQILQEISRFPPYPLRGKKASLSASGGLNSENSQNYIILTFRSPRLKALSLTPGSGRLSSLSEYTLAASQPGTGRGCYPLPGFREKRYLRGF